MSDIVSVITDNCIGCNACIRVCPAEEANVIKQTADGRFITEVDPDKCIKCGECVKACKHNARDYSDDTEKFMALVNERQTAIMVDPAIRSAMPTMWRSVLNYFKSNKVQIYDISFGGDICSWAYIRSLESKKMSNVISQQCPAVTNYILAYEPQLAAELSTVHSPTACLAMYLKRYMKIKMPVALLSPCIARKSEMEQTELWDYSLTFDKLMKYFKAKRIGLDEDTSGKLDFDFDEPIGQMGALYPRIGGLRDNLWMYNPDLSITVTTGVNSVYKSFDLYQQMPSFKHPDVYDVLSCEYGCIAGNGSGNKDGLFDSMAMAQTIEKETKKNIKTSVFGSSADKTLKKFDDMLNIVHFIRTYEDVKPEPKISEEKLEEAYNSMGKTKYEERRIDCRGCGYRSCRAMAEAICKGVNVPQNCVMFSDGGRENQQAVIVHEDNEKLAEITNTSKKFANDLVKRVELINESVQKINNAAGRATEKTSIVSTLLDKIILFCSGHEEMDAETLKQLTNILERTTVTFKALDNDVAETTSGTAAIGESTDELVSLAEELNAVLNSAEKVTA